MSLLVGPCTYKAARFAVEHWHYSRAMPTPPLVKFGVWEAGAFVGCVLYGRGANKNLYGQFGLGQTDGAELVRVALRAHQAPVSQVVAETLRQLKRHCPGTRLVVSFADPNEGHHGGIYQAGNWLYTGLSAPGVVYYDRSGRKWHPRQVSSTGVKPQYGALRIVPRTSDLQRVELPGKHRYVMPLDKAMRRRLAPLALPFPRGSGLRGEPAAVQAEGPGSIPGDRSPAEAVTGAE